MSEKTVHKIFIFILIFLPLQYILVGILGYYKAEPWPAFVFPGFKNVYETEEHYLIRQTRFELYDDQNERIASVTPYHFFPEIPRSQIAGLMRSVFLDTNKIETFSPEGKEFLNQISLRITGADIRRMEIVHKTEFLESRAGDLKADSLGRELIGTIYFTE